MMIRWVLPLVISLALGCATLDERAQIERLADLDVRCERLSAFIGDDWGDGGQEVLRVAYEALREKHAAGEGLLVGLEDLWTHSLQEGQSLFNMPDRLWGISTAAETSDMIGQSTVGPWQMTTWNIRDNYGPRYGARGDWTDAETHSWCAEHPHVQAKMIIDYIQLSYELFGRRSPYAIQRYFWLEPFVRGEIGQAENWTLSPVAHPPAGGTWEDLTPELMRETGFYGQQILLGARYTRRGLLHWLVVTGDLDGAREVLRTWRDQRRLVIHDEPTGRGITFEDDEYVLTDEPGGFAITVDDLVHESPAPAIDAQVAELIEEVGAESP
jgi:hypothetical protein